MVGFYIFLAVVASAVAGIALYFAARGAARRRIFNSLATTLFLIKIPRASAPTGSAGGSNSENKDFQAELAHFEQLLGSLASTGRSFAFEIAVPHVGEEIHFYFSVPKLLSEVAAKQIQGRSEERRVGKECRYRW